MTALTPLGHRTLTEFKKRYGDKLGAQKFKAAMDSGLLDRSKLENVFVVGDGDTSGTEGSQEELAAVDRAVDRRNIAGLDSVTSRPEPQPNPSKPGKRRVPTGLPNLGRGARGAYQSRPG
jgi:hypothetical protein